jgi:hypothetical protein
MLDAWDGAERLEETNLTLLFKADEINAAWEKLR